MTETRTLQFESARAVHSLYANDLKLLKMLEDSLGVKVTTRDGWVKLEGEAEELKEENKKLIDRLLESAGQSPFYREIPRAPLPQETGVPANVPMATNVRDYVAMGTLLEAQAFARQQRERAAAIMQEARK